jgi:hypothetical protein
MDTDTARLVVDAALRSSAQLQELLPRLTEKCSPEEYETYLKAIARAVAEISLEVMDRVFQEHPGLEAEIEARVEEERRRLKP